jgi:hypothetical protein
VALKSCAINTGGKQTQSWQWKAAKAAKEANLAVEAEAHAAAVVATGACG